MSTFVYLSAYRVFVCRFSSLHEQTETSFTTTMNRNTLRSKNKNAEVIFATVKKWSEFHNKKQDEFHYKNISKWVSQCVCDEVCFSFMKIEEVWKHVRSFRNYFILWRGAMFGKEIVNRLLGFLNCVRLCKINECSCKQRCSL